LEKVNLNVNSSSNEILSFNIDYIINKKHWNSEFNNILININNLSKDTINFKPLKLISSKFLSQYYFSKKKLVLKPLNSGNFQLSIPSDTNLYKENLFLIYSYKFDETVEFNLLKILIPKWISLLNYVQIWKKTRDIELVSKRIENDGLKISRTLFELLDLIFRFYGFFDWTLYISDFTLSHPTSKSSLEKAVDKTFANLITGWKGAGLYKTIQDPEELKKYVDFFELNSNLKNPNIENIKRIIERRASKCPISNEELFRISNILSGIGTDIFTLKIYSNAIYDISRNILPDLNIENNIKYTFNKKEFELLADKAKNIPFSKLDDKIKAFQRCLIPSILKQDIENLAFVIANISYLKGIKYYKERKNQLSNSFLKLAINGFQIIESEQMLLWSSYWFHVNDFYIKYYNENLIESLRILDNLSSEIQLYSSAMKEDRILEFLINSYHKLSRNFYFEKDFKVSENCISEVKKHLEEIRKYNDNFYTKYTNLIIALSKEIAASKLHFLGKYEEKIILLEEAKKIYYNFGEENTGKPLIHIILNYKGLLEMEKGNFEEAQNLFSKAYKTADSFNHESSLYKARAEICNIFIDLKNKDWPKLEKHFKAIYEYKHKSSTYVLIKSLEIIFTLIQNIENDSITRKILTEKMDEFLALTWTEFGFIISDTFVELFYEIYSSATLNLLKYPDTLSIKILNTALERISSESFIKHEFELISLVDLLERPWAFYLEEKALLRYRKFEEFKYLDPNSLSLREDGLFQLISALENQLAYILRFYLNLFKVDSIQEISTNIDLKELDRLALGDIVRLFKYLYKKHSSKFDKSNVEWQLIENEIIPLRNEIAHGRLKKIKMSQIIRVEQLIVDIFESISYITPIHFVVNDKMLEKYKVDFKVGVPFITSLISTKRVLECNREYLGLIESKTKDELVIVDIIEFDY